MPYRVLSSEEIRDRGISMRADVPAHINLKVIAIDRLKIPYPAVDFHVVESKEIQEIWEEHLKVVPLSDPRKKKMDVQLLDKNRLQYDVQEGESIIFVDSETSKTVLVVIQNLMNDPSIVSIMNGACIDQLNKTSQYMRDDDPGRMASVGYTAGQLSSGDILWGKGLKTKHTPEQAYAISCIFAYSWQHALKVLPPEVINDFEKASQKLGGLQMDGGAFGTGEGVLRYTIKREGIVTDPVVSPLAPPSGTVATNYVRGIHNEQNFNKYCVSHTTSRSHPPEFGGNFFNATHSIRVPGRTDQLVAWAGIDFHGTSLPKANPIDPNTSFRQSGLAFILAKRLLDSKAKMDRNRENGVFDETSIMNSMAPEVPPTFDEKEVELKPQARAVLSIRTPYKERLPNKIYSKDRIETFHIPDDHRYKDWSKKQMIEELLKRHDEDGKPLVFNKSKSKRGMMYVLLRNDGAEVSVTYTDPPRAESGNMSQGTTQDEVEENDSDVVMVDWKEEDGGEA